MDPDTVRTKMMEQVEKVRQSKMTAVFGWEIEGCDTTAFVTLRPRRSPAKAYLLRCAFDDFPARAPSYVFVHAQPREMTPDAWPPNVRHGGEPPGICTPGTREFHEHYHRGDAQYPWDPARYSFLDTLQRIQKMMEAGLGI